MPWNVTKYVGHFDCIYSENKNILKTTFLACATAILEGGFCLLSSCTGLHSRWTSLVAQTVKRLSTMWETWVQSLGREDPLKKATVTHSRTLAWKIPWTEEPGRLQSMGSLRVGHNWATSLSLTLKVEVFDLMDLSESYLLHLFPLRSLKGIPGRHLQVGKHTENAIVSDQFTSGTAEHGESSPQVQTEFGLFILVDQCLLFCYWNKL